MPFMTTVRNLLNPATYKVIIGRLDRIYIGRYEVSLYLFLRTFLRNFNRHEILTRAGDVAFNLTLSVFPALIFLLALIPYIPIPDLYDYILSLIGELAMFEQVTSTIEDLVNRPRGDVLSFGVLFALFLATNGMITIMKAFNKIYQTHESRSTVRMYLIAFGLTILLAFALFISIALLIVGQILLSMLAESDIFRSSWQVYGIITMRFVIIFALFIFTIATIYYLAPALNKRWRFFSPGVFIASGLIIAISYGFSFYVSNFGTYNKLYGSVGTMIAFMIWLNVVGVVLLAGFEVNASLDQVIKRTEGAQQ
ncbi:MAG: YihY/virulence factor BrkB family protein [Cyclobacteriaceae bacterium]|nr:YihY/virulence factor BrkB family protein [Cyclobacteriaceae bacterium]